MKPFTKTLIVFLFLLFATTAIAQDVKTAADRWAGMVVNVSTPEDAVHLFGAASKDKNKVALELPRPISWLSDKSKEKIFRTLTYKRIQEFENVQLSFLDGKLVAVSMEAPNAEIEDKWIDPDDLEALFGVVFKPSQRQHGRKLPTPSEFRANSPSELKKGEYDYWYDMIGVSEQSLVVAIADNYKYISGLFESPDAKRRKKINARGTRYPGYVSDIEIISPTLVPLLARQETAAPLSDINLATIGAIASKGRVQDQDYNDLAIVKTLIAHPNDSVPYLISKLEDETKIEGHVIDHWYEVRVGDVALLMLTDFFTDSSWQNTTIPGVGWDEFLERGSNRELTSEQVLRNYVSKHGRNEIKNRWQKIWQENSTRLFWDEKERCFRVRA